MQKKLSWFWRVMLVLLLVSALVPLAIAPAAAKKSHKVSRFGEYSGYAEPVYDGGELYSHYVAVRDGTRLAVDFYRPTKNGEMHTEPLPVIWVNNRYMRRSTWNADGGWLRRSSHYVHKLMHYGYVLAVVEPRGVGASYDTRHEPFDEDEIWDGYDLTEWFAAQPWCNGNVGMIGGSYLGISQYLIASTRPPSLKAIFPWVAYFDMYWLMWPGGVFQENLFEAWSYGVSPEVADPRAVPVDEDPDGSMMAAAQAEHVDNQDIKLRGLRTPYRNSYDTDSEGTWYYDTSTVGYLRWIEASGVGIYHAGGWYDCFTRDTPVLFNNLKNPAKMLIGPWEHDPMYGGTPTQQVEMLRWFDYWLKGIDNKIMDQAPINYFVMRTPYSLDRGTMDGEWRSAWQWPLPNEKPTRLYFDEGPSGSVNSVNDGSLSSKRPKYSEGKDDYLVDYSTTTSTASRWVNAYGGPFNYTDMTANDQKALTYTTHPLAKDVEVTGHPVVNLWVSSSASDGDFYVYLEEVDSDGYSHYITEGNLRASHRAIVPPTYDFLGLPWHRSYDVDVIWVAPGSDPPDEPLDKPVELAFDLHPTSNIFDAGNRIRVTVACADKDNMGTPELTPAPTVSVYRGSKHASYITLPIVKGKIKGQHGKGHRHDDDD